MIQTVMSSSSTTRPKLQSDVLPSGHHCAFPEYSERMRGILNSIAKQTNWMVVKKITISAFPAGSQWVETPVLDSHVLTAHNRVEKFACSPAADTEYRR